MSFPTNWDVNKYHDPAEFIEHWNLRKAFMLKHKTKFPEARLAGLAKMFYNMEFLGCVYHSELMILVQNLAAQVDEIVQYRNKKKLKLQRTFVKASDAVKRHIDKTPTSTTSKIQYVNFVSAEPETKRPKVDPFIDRPELKTYTETIKNSNEHNKPQEPLKIQTTQPPPATLSKSQQRKLLKKEIENRQKNRFKLRFVLNPEDEALIAKVKSQKGARGKLVLYETQQHTTPYGQLQYAVSRLNINMKINKEEDEKYVMYMDDEYITEIPIPEDLPSMRKGSKKYKVPEEVRNEICEKAINHFKKYCFTLIDHNTKNTEQISTDNIKNKTHSKQFELSMDGIGAKMMKQMGWGGKGLGKDGKGIIEPIQAEIRVYRRGFGQGSDEAFNKSIREYFQNYLDSGETKRLIFSTDFSKDDRAKLHLIAGQFGLLKSRSYGRGDERYITIERKLSGWDIVEQLLANGGSNDCYTLVKPTDIH